MKFLKLEDTIVAYEKAGFSENDYVIALLADGEVRHGRLTFITEYTSLFEVQLLMEGYDYKTLDLCGASVSKVEVIK